VLQNAYVPRMQPENAKYVSSSLKTVKRANHIIEWFVRPQQARDRPTERVWAFVSPRLAACPCWCAALAAPQQKARARGIHTHGPVVVAADVDMVIVVAVVVIIK
jgi:hypothetical protein